MLSVLIPVYNAYVDELTIRLVAMCRRAGVPFEILLGDDASESRYAVAMDDLCSRYAECRVLRLATNHGPAFLRNRLAEASRYPYLLFLDADVLPAADTFVDGYLAVCGRADVVCGGFCYEEQHDGLRHKYGREIESQRADVRRRQPYQHFCSMNFLIARKAMTRVAFDESYCVGYEDCDFGRRLAGQGLSVWHIENAVIHCVTESTEAYLAKIRRAIDSLRPHETELADYVRLVRWHNTVRRMRLEGFMAWLYGILGRRIERRLMQKNPSLMLFAFYKLLYICAS